MYILNESSCNFCLKCNKIAVSIFGVCKLVMVHHRGFQITVRRKGEGGGCAVGGFLSMRKFSHQKSGSQICLNSFAMWSKVKFHKDLKC